MIVRQLLEEKDRVVVTIQPHRLMSEAAFMLAEKRIGAVVVAGADGSVVLGILSERDVVRAVARSGAKALEEPVSAHMTARVVFCNGEMSVVEVMQAMTAGKFRHMPVIEHDRLVGIISIGDVVKSRLAEIEVETDAMRTYIATA